MVNELDHHMTNLTDLDSTCKNADSMHASDGKADMAGESQKGRSERFLGPDREGERRPQL